MKQIPADINKQLKYVLHAMFLIIVTLLLQRSLFLYKDESSIIQLSTFLKAYVFPEQKPDPQDFLFINTSFDNALVDVFDETGYITIGNQVITDRQKLIKLLTISNQTPTYRYLIFDVFFDLASPFDDELEALLQLSPRSISSHYLNNEDKIILPRFDINTGGVSVLVLDDQFTKFRLSYTDSSYSLPLKTYLNHSGKSYRHGDFISFLDGRPMLNTFFLNYYINTYDLKNARDYPMINLGELLFLGQDNINELLKDRWVIVGDFQANDNIETLFGSIPGPLLLTNVLIALDNSDMSITTGYITFLFISFYLLSSIILNPSDLIARTLNRLRFSELLENFLKGISLAVMLTLISTFSYLLFYIHINIFIILIYLYAIDYIVRYSKKRSNNVS